MISRACLALLLLIMLLSGCSSQEASSPVSESINGEVATPDPTNTTAPTQEPTAVVAERVPILFSADIPDTDEINI